MARNYDPEDNEKGVSKKATWPYGVQPKMNSPTRSLLAINAMNGWVDPMKIYDTQNGTSEDINLWDHARTANNDSSLCAGAGELPAVSAPIPKRSPQEPGGTGDPSEPAVLSERLTWNTPSSSNNTSNLKPNNGESWSWMTKDPGWNHPANADANHDEYRARAGRRGSDPFPTGGNR